MNLKVIQIKIVISVVIVIFVMAVLLMIFCLFIGYPNPPKPKITYAEFPFKLTYEIDGEEKVIEDVVICEYDGIKSLGEAGKIRKWKSHLKSGNEKIILLKVDDNLEFYFNYGDPENYMGDYQSGRYGEDLYYDLSYIPYIKREEGRQVADSVMLSDEVWDKYRLKIIDWQYTSPIKNSFN